VNISEFTQFLCCTRLLWLITADVTSVESLCLWALLFTTTIIENVKNYLCLCTGLSAKINLNWDELVRRFGMDSFANFRQTPFYRIDRFLRKYSFVPMKSKLLSLSVFSFFLLVTIMWLNSCTTACCATLCCPFVFAALAQFIFVNLITIRFEESYVKSCSCFLKREMIYE